MHAFLFATLFTNTTCVPDHFLAFHIDPIDKKEIIHTRVMTIKGTVEQLYQLQEFMRKIGIKLVVVEK